jgi:enoyl-CoA hydratase/carnithine racemase
MAVLDVDVQARVATLTLNRPERRNALNPELLAALVDAFVRLRDERQVRVVVLTGAGTQAFCAGADLGTMADGATTLELHAQRGRLAELFGAMWALGKPTIAAVRGFCLAGGFGLALACDLVVAADDAVFATPEIDVGLWPYQITVPLLRSMPPKVALELMMTARRVDAAEANRLGFVSRVVPPDALMATVGELAAALAAKPPSAMAMGRTSFYRVLDATAEEALPLLHALLSVTAGGEEAREGLDAFRDKRPPSWRTGA